ncbi:RHS repeat domain-containing protein [Selenihalanaerobacter shriftii]|uniref:YD repeat-containing protein n=1 Tax=Selenihalanaerobacter shriftii TaxID=142842 RepID=A0A1T4ND63_9FIRM|nr:hypothetical protein [Selenihalanaerobacter shriftii]SJZ77194.1 YD repeat-containing protein [Selenihalanaerobacter shriftii]
MKKINKVLILLLALTLILTLTACTEERSNAKQTLQDNQKIQAKSKETNNKQDKSEQEPYYKLSKEQQEKVYLVVKVIREDVDSGKKHVTRIEKYDNQDRLLSEVDKNEKGEVTGYEKYEYDDEGRLIKKADTKLFMGDQINIFKVYNYNQAGRKKGYIIKTARKGSKLGKGIYEYYDNGKLKYKYTEDILNGLVKKFYYNKKGEKTKVIDDSDGIFEIHTVSSFKREYDEQGRMIKETEIKTIKDTGEEIIDVSHFNKFGKITKSITKNENTTKFWFEWEYDENGNEIKFVSRDSNGTIKRIRKNKYDKNGNKIEDFRRARKDNGEFWIFLWVNNKYNEEGDIIKSIEKDKKGIPLIITYYKYQIIK